ncbi:MAG: tetratricopeptide repeat protein [Nitrospiraceae bacterium]|nr:MAG: tetratricopeptide repeat protein [Nitrospiraceae bacterium]
MTSKKRVLFYGSVILLPVLFLIALEGILHVAGHGQRPGLFIPARLDGARHEYLMVNPQVAERFFPGDGFIPRPPHELFLRNKPRNGYRIFVMGGSTAAGWPYPNNVLFSRILRQRLADTFPDREFEIINTGMAAVNSYTLLDFMDEIIKQEPDAILIYAGHNEFYGAFGAASTISFGRVRQVVKLALSLQRFRTVMLLRGLITAVRSWTGQGPGDNGRRHPTLMSQVIGQTSILLGSPLYEQGRRQFQDNLREILQKARDSGVPVVLSELVSNVRDHRPFASEGTAILPPSGDVYEQARKLESENTMEEARLAYDRAKDLDTMRFRASEDFNQVIHHMAGEFGVPVVPMKEYFEAASPHRLIGNNLMLEHLHPNVDGHFLMSDAFFDTLHRHGFIEKKWDPHIIRPASYYRDTWGITELDRALGKIRVMNLMDHWPFKPESESRQAAKNYVPTSQAEVLAQQVFFERVSFKDAHREMAGYFMSQGRHGLAVKEYEAILAADPLDLKSCHDAASFFLDVGAFDAARPFLERILKLSDSGFAYKWTGQLLLFSDKLHEGIPYLEKALQYLPGDPQLLFNLTRAYILTGQTDKAGRSFAALEQADPRFPDITRLKAMLDQMN